MTLIGRATGSGKQADRCAGSLGRAAIAIHFQIARTQPGEAVEEVAGVLLELVIGLELGFIFAESPPPLPPQALIKLEITIAKETQVQRLLLDVMNETAFGFISRFNR